MDLNAKYEVAIQRMVNLLAEVTKKAKAVQTCSPSKKLIEDLNVFQIFIEKEMRTTPMMQHAYEIQIFSSREDLKRAVKDVQCFNVLLEEERSKFDDFKRETIFDIAKEESILQSFKKIAEKNIAEQIKKSEEEMLATRKEHHARIELLQKEINSFVGRISLINVKNTAREEDLQKIHLETQNKSIELLAKYDRDIGAKCRLFEKLTLKNNILEKEQKELCIRLANQNVLYVQLKEEQEEAITKAFVEGLEKFKRNRAAKIIQRTWRSYRERLLLKKKKKKTKKK
ncbi:hypothetical protein KPH14_001100 [Odynerus spinipes]|uniref:Dynein regulatory complex protein 10 n=1 Tax=Odynerus spinipes TaxID=1348599 RepID=A0AAD9VKD3_9HYME|nr:hypothetical protein KPH14_001100 [Odynerus spinipes]